MDDSAAKSVAPRPPSDATPPRTVRRLAKTTFATPELAKKYASWLEEAQSALLENRLPDCERCAICSIRIRPCVHAFSMLEQVAERRLDFRKAKEFRLMRCFLAKDANLWREVYGECMDDGDFLKATMCLHRLAALETDSTLRRQLLLHRAELLVALNVPMQARTIYRDLWDRSGHTDFEVFALLSSLYFQLGRFTALETLVDDAQQKLLQTAAGDSLAASGSVPMPPTGRKRRRAAGDGSEPPQDQAGGMPAAGAVSDRIKGEIASGAMSPSPVFADIADSFASRGLDLNNDADTRRQLLTLANVRMEVLLERGNYAAAVALPWTIAKLLRVSTSDLPPDVIARLAIATALMGNADQAAAIAEELMRSCLPHDFGDILYDVTDALLKIGSFELALRVVSFMKQDATFRASAALAFAEARCHAGLGNITLAVISYRAVLAFEPRHAKSRIGLATLLADVGDDQQVVRLLEVDEALDDPFECPILRAELARWHVRQSRFVEAVCSALPVFDTLINAPSSEDMLGDRQSVASGFRGGAAWSRKNLGFAPSVVRASSVLVPADVIEGPLAHAASQVDALRTGVPLSLAVAANLATASRATSSAAQAVATSFRAASHAQSKVALSRRGALSSAAGLQSTTSGKTIAASAIGADNTRGREGVLFAFKRRRSKVDEIADKSKSDPLLRKALQARKGAADERDEDEANSVGNMDDLREAEAMLMHKSSSSGDVGLFPGDGDAAAAVRDADGFLIPQPSDAPSASQPFDLPSLETVANGFGDPLMAAAFLRATAGQGEGETAAALVGIGYATRPQPQDEEGFGVGVAVERRASLTRQDLYIVLGLPGIVDLAMLIVRCYERLGQLADAAEFARLVCSRAGFKLRRQSHGPTREALLLAPLRHAIVRNALGDELAAGGGGTTMSTTTADGIRGLFQYCMQCVEDSATAAERREAWLVFNRLAYGLRFSGIPLVRRLILEEQRNDPELLIIVANKHFISHNYVVTARLLERVRQLRLPQQDPYLTLVLGLCYLFGSRVTRGRPPCRTRVMIGFSFIRLYGQIVLESSPPTAAGAAANDDNGRIVVAPCGGGPVDPRRHMEVAYNTACCMHQLDLLYCAQPLYEEVLETYFGGADRQPRAVDFLLSKLPMQIDGSGAGDQRDEEGEKGGVAATAAERDAMSPGGDVPQQMEEWLSHASDICTATAPAAGEESSDASLWFRASEDNACGWPAWCVAQPGNSSRTGNVSAAGLPPGCRAAPGLAITRVHGTHPAADSAWARGLRAAAAFNLSLIYRHAGNHPLAEATLQRYATVSL